MTCFHPIRAFYPLETDIDGKRYLKFGKQRRHLNVLYSHNVWLLQDDIQSVLPFSSNIYDAPYNFPVYYDSQLKEVGLNITVPCGKCIGCRLDYSRMWATRSANEAFMHNHYNDCAFLTLTFNNEMLNRRENPHSLNKTAFRTWLKRLRKAVKANYDKEFRFMACGEYGAKHKRPHYHIIIYGFNFPDSKPFKINKVHGKDVIYKRSKFLESVWRPAHCSDSFGFSVIGDVNFESSAYVARYVTKKLFGSVADRIYKDIEPEFLLTSRMPGLGYDFMVKYQNDIFNHGYIMLPNKHKAPIPRYYVNKLQEVNPELYNRYRIVSFDNMYNNLFIENLDSTTERLMCREELKKQQLNILYRQYEFDNN